MAEAKTKTYTALYGVWALIVVPVALPFIFAYQYVRTCYITDSVTDDILIGAIASAGVIFLLLTLNFFQRKNSRQGIQVWKALPSIAVLSLLAAGVLALITDWTTHIAVYKSAGTPFSHTAVVSSRAKTRGCQIMITFYEPSVGGNVSICPEWLAYGSGLGFGPKLGERVRVDGVANPLGARITALRPL